MGSANRIIRYRKTMHFLHILICEFYFFPFILVFYMDVIYDTSSFCWRYCIAAGKIADDFERKKGNQQSEYCYLKSDIRQERKIAEYDEWTVESCKKRRAELEKWIIERWGIDKHFVIPNNLAEDDLEDELIELQNE